MMQDMLQDTLMQRQMAQPQAQGQQQEQPMAKMPNIPTNPGQVPTDFKIPWGGWGPKPTNVPGNWLEQLGISGGGIAGGILNKPGMGDIQIDGKPVGGVYTGKDVGTSSDAMQTHSGPPMTKRFGYQGGGLMGGMMGQNKAF